MESSTRFERNMSSSRDFPNGPFEVKTRYLLCTSPRVGSTVLGQMLTDTGCAGDPLEYLAPVYLQPLLARLEGKNALRDVMSFLEAHRTSSNGVFGIQIHWAHFVNVFKDQTAARDAFFDGFDKVIFMRRRDRVGQAMSLWRATRSNLWNSLDEDAKQQRYSRLDEGFDPTQVAGALRSIVAEDQGWQRYLASRGAEFLEIHYEDLIADWDGVGRATLNYFVPYAMPIPQPALRQQRPESDPLALEFKRYIGCA